MDKERICALTLYSDTLRYIYIHIYTYCIQIITECFYISKVFFNLFFSLSILFKIISE